VHALEAVSPRVESAPVAQGLRQNVLRADGELLRLDDSDDLVVQPKRLVRGARGGLLFLGAARGRGRLRLSKAPTRRIEPRVDALLSGLPLGLVGRHRQLRRG
jgi:hypothetical protein